MNYPLKKYNEKEEEEGDMSSLDTVPTGQTPGTGRRYHHVAADHTKCSAVKGLV
jgi:hypothetical protein